MAGWFRLVNGDKALAFITDRRSVLYIPTDEACSVLLSIAKPAQILDLLVKEQRAP